MMRYRDTEIEDGGNDADENVEGNGIHFTMTKHARTDMTTAK